MDPSGSAYIVGITASTDFPTTLGAFQTTTTGGFCVYGQYAWPCNEPSVTKLNAEGSALVYSSYLGGSGREDDARIAVDASGNAYVAGYTNSTDFPLRNPIQPSLHGGFDAFVAKVDTEGSSLIYSTYLGGSRDDITSGIAIDSSLNAYVAGSTFSGDFPLANPLQASGSIFVTKLNEAGTSLQYSTRLGGSGMDQAASVAVDPSGNAYVTFGTFSGDLPTTEGAFQSNLNLSSPCPIGVSQCEDVAIMKLNAAGSGLVYCTYLGGSGQEFPSGIALDSCGNAYVTGSAFALPAFPTASPLQADCGWATSWSCGMDVFVTKLNATGTGLVYSTYLGGASYDRGRAIAVDSSGSAYVTGVTGSPEFPVGNPIQANLSGVSDAFVAKISPEDNTAGRAPVEVRLTRAVALSFENVSASGTTGLTTSRFGPPPPTGFRLGDPPRYYELTTTAAFTGFVKVCINYSGVSFHEGSEPRLFHLEGGEWVDVTTPPVDTSTKIICGTVTSLWHFAVFQPLNQPPMAHAGPDQRVIVGELAQLDGSGSSDPDGTIASYIWDFGDGASADGVTASHVYISAGTFTVTLTVTDSNGSTATDTAIVTVKTTAQAIQDLAALVGSYNLQQGIANSLDAKLQNALDALNAANAGQRQDAANKLMAFLNAVEAQRGKELNNAQADALVSMAMRIVAVL